MKRPRASGSWGTPAVMNPSGRAATAQSGIRGARPFREGAIRSAATPWSLASMATVVAVNQRRVR